MDIICRCGCCRMKLMWEYYGSGLWCLSCGAPVKLDEIPLPPELAMRIHNWNRRCARLGRREMRGERIQPSEWGVERSEARLIWWEMNNYVPTFLYQKSENFDGIAPRCPTCTRRIMVQGRRDGFFWGICDECLYWVVSCPRREAEGE